MTRMSKQSAVGWLLPGVFVSVFDAWLSVQSMVGVMQPRNPLGFGLAIILGMSLTVFAVLSPLWAGRTRSLSLMMLRYALLAIDIATSVIGALWYGMMHGDLRKTVDFDAIHYNPGNWLPTCAFVAVVLIVAWVCHQLGRALWTLNLISAERREQAGRRPPSHHPGRVRQHSAS